LNVSSADAGFVEFAEVFGYHAVVLFLRGLRDVRFRVG
jgi:hypothetical protein